MKIMLNGEAFEATGSSLGELLAELDYVDGQVATAVNGEFVSNVQRDETRLNEGDCVDVIAPMAGG